MVKRALEAMFARYVWGCAVIRWCDFVMRPSEVFEI